MCVYLTAFDLHAAVERILQPWAEVDLWDSARAAGDRQRRLGGCDSRRGGDYTLPTCGDLCGGALRVTPSPGFWRRLVRGCPAPSGRGVGSAGEERIEVGLAGRTSDPRRLTARAGAQE